MQDGSEVCGLANRRSGLHRWKSLEFWPLNPASGRPCTAGSGPSRPRPRLHERPEGGRGDTGRAAPQTRSHTRSHPLIAGRRIRRIVLAILVETLLRMKYAAQTLSRSQNWRAILVGLALACPAFSQSPPKIMGTYAGTTWTFQSLNQPAVAAALSNFLGALTVDAAGHLVVPDADHNAVFRISADGILQSAAGNGLRDFSGEGGAAANASLSGPSAVVYDPSGNL